MIMPLIGVHHASDIETSFKPGDSVNVTQRAFCAQFILNWNDAVSNRKMNLL